MHHKPFYVDRGGEQVYRPPFNAENVDFFGFVLNADRHKMQHSICDLCLNNPSGGTEDFVIAMPYAMAVFNNMTGLASIDPPFNERGVFPEKEFALWTLVLDRKRERLFWFQPYIFVDNAYALSMGREIYGFPKELGFFDMPSTHEDPARFAMETIVVDKFRIGAMAERKTLVEVKRTGDGLGGLHPVDDIETLAEAIGHALLKAGGMGEDLKLLGEELDDLWHLNVMMAFLKQFRAAGEPTKADFQSITTLDCRMTQFHGGHLYTAPYAVDFGDFDSHPIRSDLGLAAGPLIPLVSFWARFNFWIGPGKTLWAAGT